MFYLINKKVGESSFYAIKKFAKNNNIKKIGHTGTLDPLASGLLLVACDYSTKLIQYISNKTKGYICELQFGYATDTYDIEGQVTNTSSTKVTLGVLEMSLDKISQLKTQIPPIYSAKKINGKRAYEYAREKIDIQIKEHKINIYNYKLVEFDFQSQKAKISFEVSEGTYIRTLVDDLGKMCNSYATMTALFRNKIGDFEVEILNNQEFKEINPLSLFNLDTYKYTAQEKHFLKDGRSIKSNLKNGTILLLNSDNQISGVAQVTNNVLKVKNLFIERL
ncbi:tRNA pseudouridine(55) synthase TruB [Mycoplasmopsis ciconiae]|uniref:tRNA pseudouridine synthase B n=1 Tax=Mycoplasmopsis ciconiae TaxID=561067 RepID=A0ABU7MLE1_9BACT|nr:tRNA pseudouridine(55) synthase TruB [Mycoplasmopsis ciconiae]